MRITAKILREVLSELNDEQEINVISYCDSYNDIKSNNEYVVDFIKVNTVNGVEFFIVCGSKGENENEI